MRCHPGDGELSEGRLPEADAGAEAERRTVSSAKKRWTAGKAPLQDSRSWKTLSRRSDHRADDHADDLPVLGPFVDDDRPVLGVAAARLQLDSVVGRPVKALQRDLGPDPGHHDVALGRVGGALDRDDVAGPVPDGRHAVAPHDHVEVRLGMDLAGQLVGHPHDGLALVGEDRRAGGHLGQPVGGRGTYIVLVRGCRCRPPSPVSRPMRRV